MEAFTVAWRYRNDSWIKDWSMSAKTVYMYVTYLLWGSVAYSAINIPYGSMVSALTATPNERTDLSTSWSVGAILAQLFIGGLAPIFIYEVVDGNPITKTDSTFMWVAGLASLIGFITHLVTDSFTTERVSMDVQKTKGPSLLFRTVSRQPWPINLWLELC